MRVPIISRALVAGLAIAGSMPGSRGKWNPKRWDADLLKQHGERWAIEAKQRAQAKRERRRMRNLAAAS